MGEQPGDQEDIQGRPFVGPAGRLLDEALLEAGIPREEVYVTNAVKHFKFVERGKRRIHQKPRGMEMSACWPWLEAEMAALKPHLIVCLGSTAAQSLLGRDVRVLSERGRFFAHPWAKSAFVTIHPSALLRIPEPAAKILERGRFVEDMKKVRAKMEELAAA